jgi:hypothetical protein
MNHLAIVNRDLISAQVPMYKYQSNPTGHSSSSRCRPPCLGRSGLACLVIGNAQHLISYRDAPSDLYSSQTRIQGTLSAIIDYTGTGQFGPGTPTA